MGKKFKKLNLGCGSDLKKGYINVDKFGSPDKKVDLEKFPWPWKDNSVKKVLLKHTLEHLGADTKTYLNIIKELYRICKPNAIIEIIVPHPRHDHFLNDPTHVRPITPDGLMLFSKKANRLWEKNGISNTKLGLFLDVDFEIISSTYDLDPVWQRKLDSKEMDEDSILTATKLYNNVVAQTRIVLKVIK